MKPFTLAVAAAALFAAAACGPKAKPTTHPDDGTGIVNSPNAKKIQLSWGITQAAHSADIFLQTTDERGAQVPHALGTFDGQCASVTPSSDMHAMLAAVCSSETSGTQLQVVVRDAQVIILRIHTTPGVKPDPMSADELTRFPAPPGAGIEAKP